MRPSMVNAAADFRQIFGRSAADLRQIFDTANEELAKELGQLARALSSSWSLPSVPC